MKELGSRGWAKKWGRVGLVVALLVLTVSAPAVAQTDTSTATATPTGPSYPACTHGPPAPDQTPVPGEITETRLVVETRHIFPPNSTYGYEVYRVGPDTRELVTDSATVESSNTSILSVNQADQTLTSVNNENVSTWVRVNASTADYSGCTNVMVTQTTVENLRLVPGVWRFVAVLQDPSLFALLIAVFLAVATTRFTSSFGGLAIGQITLVVGWLGGWVEWPIVVASLFTVLFVGMNVAANVDYQSGRLGK